MTTPTTYLRPATIAEALELARQRGAVALAGGAATVRGFDLPFETFVDLQAIPELRRIEESESNIYFGAGCTLQQVVESADVPGVVQRALMRAIPLNWRQGATVGESLLHPALFSEWAAALVAHDAGIEFLRFSGEPGVEAASALLAEAQPFAERLMTGLHIPRLAEGERMGAAQVARTPADAPIVHAAVFVQMNGDVVEQAFGAVGGASQMPVAVVDLAMLDGQAPVGGTLRRAAEAAAAALEPVADYRGSAVYRRAMAAVCLRRALDEATA